jgi:hypothetical protein
MQALIGFAHPCYSGSKAACYTGRQSSCFGAHRVEFGPKSQNIPFPKCRFPKTAKKIPKNGQKDRNARYPGPRYEGSKGTPLP